MLRHRGYDSLTALDVHPRAVAWEACLKSSRRHRGHPDARAFSGIFAFDPTAARVLSALWGHDPC
jgi:hypothetical protein